MFWAIIAALAVIFFCLVAYIVGYVVMRIDWRLKDDSLRRVQAIFLHFGPIAENGPRAEKALGAYRRARVPIVPLGRSWKFFVEYLKGEGVPTRDIITTGLSVDTVTNILEATQMVRERGWKRVAIVSSGYHRARIARIYQAAAPWLTISFRSAASKSRFHILQEPIWVFLTLLDPMGRYNPIMRFAQWSRARAEK